MGVVVGVLLLVVGAGGAVLIARGSNGNKVRQTTARASTASTAVTGSTDESSPKNDDDSRAVSCWNGTSALEVDECAALTGVRGLQWVFPSLSATWDRCSPTPLQVKGEIRIAAYRCGVDVADGSAVLVYSEYQTRADLAHSYEGRYDGLRPMTYEDRAEYGPARVAPSGDQAFYATYAYLEPDTWAVTAAAPSALVASEALATVQMRSHDDVARFE